MARPIEGRALGVMALAFAAGLSASAVAQAPPTRALLAPPAVPSVPLGDVPGSDPEAPPRTLATVNPFSGQPQAIAEGKLLFRRMNCAYCHDFEAKGLMGPSLVSGAWLYGGTPVQVFRSISDGRPQGMPSWRLALPAESIWKIVAYLESLGGMAKATATQGASQ